MTESQLMYAAMLALTKQNMAFKLAPLSTAQMQGQVINRNIAVGETVVCWMNNSGELTRVGDVPAHNGLLSRWLQVSIYISPDAALSDRRLRSDRHGDHDEQGDHRTSHPSGICDQCPSDHRGSDCPEEFQTFADPSLHLSGDRYAAVHPEADL